jgi:hypothetical protein
MSPHAFHDGRITFEKSSSVSVVCAGDSLRTLHLNLDDAMEEPRFALLIRSLSIFASVMMSLSLCSCGNHYILMYPQEGSSSASCHDTGREGFGASSFPSVYPSGGSSLGSSSSAGCATPRPLTFYGTTNHNASMFNSLNNTSSDRCLKRDSTNGPGTVGVGISYYRTQECDTAQSHKRHRSSSTSPGFRGLLSPDYLPSAGSGSLLY